MQASILEKGSKARQYTVVVVSVLLASLICYFLSPYAGYRVVALLLMVTVSILATFLDIAPVLLAAVSSALIWNFFFIPPRFTFHIDNTEDVLMFLMYFLIALINAALTYKIRQIEKRERKKEEKENTLKLYNTLLNSLSHELRTPIAAIIGAVDNLQTNSNKLSEENKADLLNEVAKASFRLNNQVDNLLNMSRLESGFIQPRKDWCDVNELVHDVVNRLKESFPKRIVNISIKENFPLVKLDIGLMEQVLHNLIHNALLYIPKYCIVTVGALCVNDKLVLIVEDNGNGFPEDEIGKVFDKFYRLKNTETGGTGLGLSIVKGFVEAHNGTIILENIADGGGARFTIEIPTEISYITQLEV
jgi:two-component system, OmpR family, sensor histidine kinase KdpD